MTNSVELSSTGYVVTQEMVDGVTNPFLDLGEAKNQIFYFLDGHYDQIVLEKIFTILNSQSDAVKKNIAEALEAANGAQRAYDEALSQYNTLITTGVYDIESLLNGNGPLENGQHPLSDYLAISMLDGNPAIFPKMNLSTDGNTCLAEIDQAYASMLSLICDLCEAEMDKISWPDIGEQASLKWMQSMLDIDVRLALLESQLEYAQNHLADLSLNYSERNSIYAEIRIAINAIGDYLASPTTGNYNDLVDALRAIDYPNNEYYEWIKNISPSVKDMILGLENKEQYNNAANALRTYFSCKTTDNLVAAQKELAVIKDLPIGVTPVGTGIVTRAATLIEDIDSFLSIDIAGYADWQDLRNRLLFDIDTSLTSLDNVLAPLANFLPFLPDTYPDKDKIAAAAVALNAYLADKTGAKLEAVGGALASIDNVDFSSVMDDGIKASIAGAESDVVAYRGGLMSNSATDDKTMTTLQTDLGALAASLAENNPDRPVVEAAAAALGAYLANKNGPNLLAAKDALEALKTVSSYSSIQADTRTNVEAVIGNITERNVVNEMSGMMGNLKDKLEDLGDMVWQYGEDKEKINAATSAINKYLSNQSTANLNAVNAALNDLSNISSSWNTTYWNEMSEETRNLITQVQGNIAPTLVLGSEMTALRNILTPLVASLAADHPNKSAINAAIGALNAYIVSNTPVNLKAVQDALGGLGGINNMTPPIAPTLSSIENMTTTLGALDNYLANKTISNLEELVDTFEAQEDMLNAENIMPPISGVIASIEAYLEVQKSVDESKTAISTFKGNKTKDNLDGVNGVIAKLNALESLSSQGKTTNFYGEKVRNEINNVINRTQETLEDLNTLTAVIEDYEDLTSLDGASAAFSTVKAAFMNLSARDLTRDFGNTTRTDLMDRVNHCIEDIGDLDKFDDFYKGVDKLMTIAENGEFQGLLSDDAKTTYYDSDTTTAPPTLTLKSPLTFTGLKELYTGENYSYTYSSTEPPPTNTATANKLMDEGTGVLSVIKAKVGSSRSARDTNSAAYGEALRGYDPTTNINNLFNLCMMASTPQPQPDGSYRLVTGISRTTDDAGNFTYTLQYGTTPMSISKQQYESSFSKEDGYKHYSLPYFSLAIMYEKVGIQQMILVEQLKQVEKINEAIRQNNMALKALNWLYDKAYAESTKDSSSRQHGISGSDCKRDTGMTITDLYNYLTQDVKSGGLSSDGIYSFSTSGNGQFNCQIGAYNRDGDPGEGSNTQNIDVKEQATLTMLSNQQDSVRIYGDKLSTDSQLMTTKMSQYMQNSNACISACSQVVKSIGDYLKTITSNVR
ncbi:MAG: hypothetical protein LBB16_01080 [Puniceicoccales bacterium]|jgi:hypothetical protein|nr:hypothetical protein [Puniceicoccales bacterium]